MRRWLLLFLLAVIPMQLSWAALASYCQHETVPAKAAHFGHHQHDHQDQAGDRHGVDLAKAKGDHAGDDTKSPLALDDDCSYCHLGCAQAPAGATDWTSVQLPSPMVALLSALHDSHFPQGLERPDRRLA
jgi:hypothetical protein